MKLAIIHQLPLEYYPPAINAIRYFSEQSDMQTLVVSSENEKGRTTYSNDNVRLLRFRTGKGLDPIYQRWRYSASWHWQTAKAIANFRPDVLLYFEPHSALAAAIYYRWRKGKARLFIHHHEYYAPSDYQQPGNRQTRINHFFERRSLFARADWISQTNTDRLRLFQEDHPEVKAQSLYAMPNFPPKNWTACVNADRDDFGSPILKLVYVGSLSLHDTYIGPLVNWLLEHPDCRMTLDIFAYNTDPTTRKFLNTINGNIVRFHDTGIAYEELPKLLQQFDVGIILYRCRTVNYQFNASNKLFEYLICGLDVWYPPAMLGVKPYMRSDAYPRVIEVDFEDLDSLPWNTLCSRKGLPDEAWIETCESQLQLLAAEMRKCCGFESVNAEDTIQ